MPVLVHYALNVPDAEADGLAVGDNLVLDEGHVQVVQFGAAHFAGPPDAGILHFFLYGNCTGFSGRQLDGNGELTVLIRAAEDALNSTRGTVPNQTFNQYRSRSKVLRLYDRSYKNVLNLDIRRGNEFHGTGNAHALVQGAGVPVHIAMVELAGLGAIYRYL